MKFNIGAVIFQL